MRRPPWTEAADAAAALLRRVPAPVWVVWAASTLPYAYLLGRLLLMASFDAYYAEQAGGWALLVAAAYLAKQAGESYFQGALLRVLGDTPPAPRLGPQFTLQPTALLVLPLAALLFFPLAPAVTFYRTLSVSTPREALHYAMQGWLLQSWELSVAMAGGILLWANLFVLWLLAPMLLRAFFGWETSFGRINDRMFNLPSFWVVTLTTYVCLDPLLNAMAARRVFLERSRRTGTDLLAALRTAAMGVVLVGGLAGPLAAQEAGELERSIAQTLREPEFAFRQPRTGGPESAWFVETLTRLAQWIQDLLAWLSPGKEAKAEAGGALVSPELTQQLVIGMALLLVAGLCFYLYRQRRRPVAATVTATAVAPDLTREDVRPDALPEESWLAMADALAGRGEYRLALRALHLAGLRRLSERGLVTIGAAKSGGEYGREVERRGRSTPQVHRLFEANRRGFEEAWYGFHELGEGGLRQVRGRWEEIRQHVG
ncbi:MAG: hypothetical protein NTX13_09550 [Acidobacteria bacterium]|nr:hypothetical protein [Acidobacteriota bacterium]